MQIHRRWLAVVVPIVVVGLIEVASDSVLDPKLPFPRDTILVMVVVSVLAIVYGRYAFGEIDRLAGTLRQRNAELEARHAEAAALHRVSVAMTALLDIDEILRAVVEKARTRSRPTWRCWCLPGPGRRARLARRAGLRKPSIRPPASPGRSSGGSRGRPTSWPISRTPSGGGPHDRHAGRRRARGARALDR